MVGIVGRMRGAEKRGKSAKRSNLASKSCRKLGDFSWKLMRVGAKLGVFCGFLRFLKKGGRAFGSVDLAGEIDINPFVSAD